MDPILQLMILRLSREVKWLALLEQIIHAMESYRQVQYGREQGNQKPTLNPGLGSWNSQQLEIESQSLPELKGGRVEEWRVRRWMGSGWGRWGRGMPED